MGVLVGGVVVGVLVVGVRGVVVGVLGMVLVLLWWFWWSWGWSWWSWGWCWCLRKMFLLLWMLLVVPGLLLPVLVVGLVLPQAHPSFFSVCASLFVCVWLCSCVYALLLHLYAAYLP